MRKRKTRRTRRSPAARKSRGKGVLPRAELQKFRALLLQLRQRIRGSVDAISNQTIGKNPAAESGDVSRLPIHMADIGSDVFEHDLNLNLVENEARTLELIEEALERIERGSFGLCENCSRPIPPARLKVIPFARLCIACKEKEERA